MHGTLMCKVAHNPQAGEGETADMRPLGGLPRGPLQQAQPTLVLKFYTIALATDNKPRGEREVSFP